MDPLLTYEDAAKVLKLSARTVRLYVARKKIKAVHIGRATRIRVGDLTKFVEARTF